MEQQPNFNEQLSPVRLDSPTPQGKKIFILFAIFVVLVLVGIMWWLFIKEAPQSQVPLTPAIAPPSPPEFASEDDRSAVIEQDLETVDLGNIEGEFKEIDQDLKTL